MARGWTNSPANQEGRAKKMEAERNQTDRPMVLLAIFFALLFLPSLGRFLLNTSSMAVGLLAACGIMIAMAAIGLYRIGDTRQTAKIIIYVILIGFFVVCQTFLASLWNTIDYQRMFSSLATLLIIIVGAHLLREEIRSVSGKTLAYCLTIVSFLFLVIAALPILGFYPIASTFAKPMFPFTEPSHYALSFAPFLIYQCVVSRTYVRIFWLLATAILALAIESLSLAVVACVAAACCLSLPVLIAGGLIAVLGLTQIDLSYFTDRLDFSIYSENVSTLVYIQGVELMRAGLQDTSWWGIGFQQLGFVPLNVPTTDIIYQILQDDANLYDGGFLAAKLIAENGVFGILICFMFAFFFVKSIILLRFFSHHQIGASLHAIFALSAISAFSVEMFVRGVGYFSSTSLLVLTAFMYCQEMGVFSRSRSRV